MSLLLFVLLALVFVVLFLLLLLPVLLRPYRGPAWPPARFHSIEIHSLHFLEKFLPGLKDSVRLQPNSAMAAGGVRVDTALAPCLVLGYADISSSGARAVMLLRELLNKEVPEARRTGSTGTLWYRHDNGVQRDCAIAWAGVDPLANLYVDTFYNDSGEAVLSLICLNSQIVEKSTSSVALSLVQKIIQDEVKQVYLLCGLRFNPKADSLQDKVHFSSLGPSNIEHQHLPEFDPRTRLNDSFMSAFVQLLKLEKGIETTLCIVPAHRLPTPLCLNLPPCEPDSSKGTYINLILAIENLALGGVIKVSSALVLSCV
ncbi:hypothetical protein GUITHDRAFT_136421 [Guillardia theta CCMP2712]|uniref:Uncharacterized protein n=1 Tax=Guillardia theta (strain CCMP2712) TaxID=905079 RepID=L1JK95_GUITC|nr:hypothetical protein GUITHDRAFT_136421 [Guillardia theta CCMP2712]EKX48742.1 hypothetical protein GUITHDRAFT_136421 [Guillardia theta CCMP2712]|eukprot:XP_005835722.1 hypothetical protein GUITHDRAFT_136421 [Guillardia theta CCMP2712]